jgi:MFS family permease
MIGFLISYTIAGLIIGLLAKRKNRNPWAWGLIGGLFLLAGLLLLAFMPYLCPKCEQPITNEEWKSRNCPRCGDISKVVSPA